MLGPVQLAYHWVNIIISSSTVFTSYIKNHSGVRGKIINITSSNFQIGTNHCCILSEGRSDSIYTKSKVVHWWSFQ